MRFQSRKRIIRDLRTRSRHRRNERRLSCVWKTHQTNIREQLQLELQVQLLSLASGLMVARSTIGRGREVRVSKSATPTARGQPAVAIVIEIVKQVACISVKDLRAHRHAHNQIITFATGTIRTFAMRTALGNVLRVIAQVQQRVQRAISYKDNIAAATAIASRWTTTRHKLLAPESRNTVTSVTPLHVNLGAINKHLN